MSAHGNAHTHHSYFRPMGTLTMDMIFYISDQIEFVSIKDGILRFEEHSHSSHIVISAPLRGRALLTVGGERRDIDAGTVFFLLPYEDHSIVSDDPVDMISLCIKKDMLGDDREAYLKLVRSAVKWSWEKEALPDGDIQGRILEAAAAIYDTYTDAPADDELLTGCRDDIAEHPEDDRDIGSLADDLYMSKFHYIRKFKKAAGLTPNRFRIQSRIRMAQQMLRSGQPITSAALDVGFYDQSHFNKYFKKIVGVSPKKYISSLRNFLQ